jgi:hypothetical protein
VYEAQNLNRIYIVVLKSISFHFNLSNLNETYGVIATDIVQMTKQILFINNASTDGKSATAPQTIRANVFVIPIIDTKNDASSLSKPYNRRYEILFEKSKYV